MKGIDHALWERELAEYISLHPDLENLPPAAFPRRRSRLGRRFWLLRQARRARLAKRRQRSGMGRWFIVITLLVVETLVLGAILGWWLGWHL